jgi:hypothetical protein
MGKHAETRAVQRLALVRRAAMGRRWSPSQVLLRRGGRAATPLLANAEGARIGAAMTGGITMAAAARTDMDRLGFGNPNHPYNLASGRLGWLVGPLGLRLAGWIAWAMPGRLDSLASRMGRLGLMCCIYIFIYLLILCRIKYWFYISVMCV